MSFGEYLGIGIDELDTTGRLEIFLRNTRSAFSEHFLDGRSKLRIVEMTVEFEFLLKFGPFFAFRSHLERTQS